METSDRPEPAHETSRGNGVHSITSKAEGIALKVRDTARAEAGHRVQELSGKAQQRLEAGRERTASRIEGVALKVRERGDTAGTIGHTAGEQVATRIEAAAGYLHEHDTSQIAGDVSTYVKRHPVQSVVAAAVLGYVFGRLAA